ncbi:MAG TPA: hypothetical protein VN578_24595 [Candidatus Binatia bacterium]|jgi:hypothetical protein|nr:hypothetical protein [Candidatus Binatia bacterium]
MKPPIHYSVFAGVLLLTAAGLPTRAAVTNLLCLTNIYGVRLVGSDATYRPLVGPGARIVNGNVGLTFNTTARNMQPTNGIAIPWGYTVLEQAGNDWITDNQAYITANEATENPLDKTNIMGFTGLSEGLQREHKFPLPPTYVLTNNCYGRHPHLQFFVFKQIDNGPLILIGCSELKHTFKVGGTGLPSQNFLPPQKEDTYNDWANEDQDFFGPVSELDDDSTVPAHMHLGIMNKSGVFERAHGYHHFPGGKLSDGTVIPADPGHDGPGHRLDHLLQVPALELLTDDQTYIGQPGKNPHGRTKWYVAASYFVNGDQFLDDNSRYLEFLPNYDGTNDFAPSEPGVSFAGDGAVFPKFLPPKAVTAITNVPPLAKWLQRPDSSPTGLDVLATRGTASPMLADDFLCTNSGPITDIYIWGSWRDDRFDSNATMTVSFWSDQPATNGQPSHPDTLQWTLDFGPLQANPYTLELAGSCCTERFLDPTQPLALGVDTHIYSYHFTVVPELAFLQTTGTIYWLSVSASGTTNLFGWKTCVTNDHHFDDATFSAIITNSHAPWVDLHYPPPHPFNPRTLDLSFALLSKESDYFPVSLAAVVIALPNGGTETVVLSGPTAIYADVGLAGETAQTITNGLDQVETEMVSLNLQGTSSLGPINLVVRRPDRSPFLRSTGMITEFTNTVAGRLDLPPFAPAGCGDSFFDVCFEVHLSNAVLGNPVWHNETPKHMDGTICNKPPGFPKDHQNTYYGFTAADLRDETGRLVAFIILSIHVPNPEPDVPVPLVPPEDQSATAGGPATFSVTAAAVSQVGALEKITYQWQRKGTNDAAFTSIPGATNSTYILTAAQLTNNGSLYQVVLTTMPGFTVISGPAVLNVALPIELLRIDQISASSGQATLTFHADAERSYSILYKDSLSTNVWPAGLWLTLTNVQASPSSRVVAIPDAPPGPERYYRLVTPAREP